MAMIRICRNASFSKPIPAGWTLRRMRRKLSSIQRGDTTFYREQNETIEDFTKRAAENTKILMPVKNAVPVLMAITQKMRSEKAA